MSSLVKIHNSFVKIHQRRDGLFNSLVNLLARSGLLQGQLDYHLVRASMVIIFLFFGYQKWFA